jgi:hypothetical protein
MAGRDRDGWSQSVWVSLAVKSLRFGWVNGLHEAEKRLGRSGTRYQLLAGILEDVTPPPAEVSACLFEVEHRQYKELCSRATHHSRFMPTSGVPMTEYWASMDGWREATRTPELRAALERHAHQLGFTSFIPQRAYANLYCWVWLGLDDVRQRRDPDLTRWRGMPACVVDRHTAEGRARGIGWTLASGDTETHRAISRRVHAEGWQPLREEFHSEIAEPDPVDQRQLFDEKWAS